MFELALTAAQEAALMVTLADSHEIRITSHVLDRNERVIDSLTDEASRLISGAVQVDSGAAVTRSLSMTLFDSRHELQFDATNPARGALYADRFISVTYDVLVPSLGWIAIPVFCGPLTKFERDGAEVTIEAQGKETLGLAPHFATKAYTIPKKTRIDTAVRKVMNRVGERRYTVPDIATRLSKPRAVLPNSEPWKVLIGGELDANGKPIPAVLAHAAKPYRAFYNGQGRLVVRRANTTSVFTFERGSHLLATPKLGYDIGEFRNFVVVTGGTPKGSKHKAHAHASLPGTHPLSPGALARNGEPRYMTEFVDAPALKTNAACLNRARQVLSQKSQQGVDAQFDSLPFPMLEEGDLVTLETDEYSITFPLRTFTIPLTSDSPMSVGFLRRVRVGRR